ncbi:hypothetical protein AAFC00_002709 [Neodothiora populina]|uniref:Demethylmenaquinone methyltransferase n=1 Tax=Neodothiora populina TaxID=2781224 RepID=A0ABR3P7Y7_9PEZI
MAQSIKALRPFASCDIGDALVRLQHPYAGYLQDLRMWSPRVAGTHGLGQAPTMIGEATTVTMVHENDESQAKPSKHFADNNQAGKVMVIKQPENAISACFGGLMGTRATQLGAAGVVIDGRFRDILEMQDMGFPVFAKGISILGSNTFTRTTALDEPVRFSSGPTVFPGDIVVGDSDGVVVVPTKLVDQVAQICHERKEIDDKMLKALQAGASMSETVAKFRK